MLEDFLVLIVLAYLGRHRLSELKAGFTRLRATTTDSSWLHHPFYRVVLLTLVLLLVGWSATLSQMGWRNLAAVLSGQTPPPSRAESDRCFEYQRNFYSRAEEFGRCPNQGELYLDGQGLLNCRRHGRPEDAAPLLP